MACVGGVIGGCESKKVPLNKEQFTNLLIDLHKVDGTLSVYRGIGQGYNELKNYEYYNDVFRKYHIDKAEFDSCLYYYSAQTVLFRRCMTWLSIVYTGNSQLLKKCSMS